MADNECIYTTGAYIERTLIDGVWRWVVTGFEDDTYKNGMWIHVNVESNTKENLTPYMEE
jgi:hypothetical protein